MNVKGPNSPSRKSPTRNDGDADNDGIKDSLEKNPPAPSTTSSKTPDNKTDAPPTGNVTGAPKVGDKDGDGIPDAKDKDVDGDGINNDKDKTNDAPKVGTDVNGKATANDTDGDGVPNNLDKNPKGADVNGKATANDVDGDGVPNNVDTTPDVADTPPQPRSWRDRLPSWVPGSTKSSATNPDGSPVDPGMNPDGTAAADPQPSGWRSKLPSWVPGSTKQPTTNPDMAADYQQGGGMEAGAGSPDVYGQPPQGMPYAPQGMPYAAPPQGMPYGQVMGYPAPQGYTPPYPPPQGMPYAPPPQGMPYAPPPQGMPYAPPPQGMPYAPPPQGMPYAPPPQGMPYAPQGSGQFQPQTTPTIINNYYSSDGTKNTSFQPQGMMPQQEQMMNEQMGNNPNTQQKQGIFGKFAGLFGGGNKTDPTGQTQSSQSNGPSAGQIAATAAALNVSGQGQSNLNPNPQFDMNMGSSYGPMAHNMSPMGGMNDMQNGASAGGGIFGNMSTLTKVGLAGAAGLGMGALGGMMF